MFEGKIPHCLYYNGHVVYEALMRPGSTVDELRAKALSDLESVPGVICDYPNEAPVERRSKILRAELRFVNKDKK